MKEFAAHGPHVAEVQGLYGAFVFSERLFQKIWMRREFTEEGLRTNDGRSLRILHPGKWNRLGGPDFRDARLLLDNQPVNGDVELHLHAEDWKAHGHSDDAMYDGVVLHVVLFPTKDDSTRAGLRVLPVVALLPNLMRGLEEYATDDTIEIMSGGFHDESFGALANFDDDALRECLRTAAEKRWQAKVRYAAVRIARLGWGEACHVTALEILGFRYNRAAMVSFAARHPLPVWLKGDDPRAWETPMAWQLQGVRPNNHPKLRLTQYAQWVRQEPNWPDRLLILAAHILENVAISRSTRDVRSESAAKSLRTKFSERLSGGVIGGTRLDTLVCDGWLPLLGAVTRLDFSGVWFHWFVGDMPDAVTMTLRELGVFSGAQHPACHGYAQGLLGWVIEREALRSLTEGSSRGVGLDNT